MAETKINASQTTITASDIGAASTAQLADKQDIIQYSAMPTASSDNVGAIVQFIGSSGSQIKFDVVDSDLTPDNPTVSVDMSKLSGLTLGDSGSLMVSYEVSENDGYIAIVDSGEDTIQSEEFGTPEEAYASVGLVFSATPAFAEVSYSSQTYTNGYFYKCTESSGSYSWTQTDVQPSPVIPDPLPSQTGQSGKFLTTNGTVASWGTINALTNNAGSGTRSLSILGNSNSSYYYCVAIGYQTQTRANRTISIGCESLCGGSSGSILISTSWSNLKYPGESSVCVGSLTSGYARANTMMVHIGNAYGDIKYGWGSVFIGNQNESVTLDAGSFYVGLMTSYSDYANSTFKLLSRDGTIPEARLADTTNATAGQVLTLDSNLNAVWVAPSGGGASSATATLVVNDWSSNTQTVNVTGVTASNNVIVAAAPASQADYTSAGILCTAQGAGTLSFSCQTVPTNAITVNILIL